MRALATSFRRLLIGCTGVAMFGMVAACNSAAEVEPVLVATSLAAIAGVDNQTVKVGQPTEMLISVLVLAQNGATMVGTPVAWTVESGGGTVSEAVSDTDINGVATTVWTVGAVAGINTLKATLENGEDITISATGVAALANSGIAQTPSRVSPSGTPD